MALSLAVWWGERGDSTEAWLKANRRYIANVIGDSRSGFRVEGWVAFDSWPAWSHSMLRRLCREPLGPVDGRGSHDLLERAPRVAMGQGPTLPAFGDAQAGLLVVVSRAARRVVVTPLPDVPQCIENGLGCHDREPLSPITRRTTERRRRCAAESRRGCAALARRRRRLRRHSRTRATG
jgi:hypothetical protein